MKKQNRTITVFNNRTEIKTVFDTEQEQTQYYRNALRYYTKKHGAENVDVYTMGNTWRGFLWVIVNVWEQGKKPC